MRKLIVLLAIAGVAWFGWERFFGGDDDPTGDDASPEGRNGVAAEDPHPGESDPASRPDPEDEPGGGRPIEPVAPILATRAPASAEGASAGSPSVRSTVEGRAGDREGGSDRASRSFDLESELTAARSLVESGDALGAVRRLSIAYEDHGLGRHRRALRAAIDPLVEELYFSRRAVPAIASFVEVRSGDTLAGIVGRLRKENGWRVAPGLIMRTNGIADARRIRAGQSLKVLSEPMRLEVSKGSHVLDVWLGDTAILTYEVGLGKNDSTPVGTFEIVTKQIEPIWFNDGKRIPFGDERNVLGTRWLGFENTVQYSGYGIHGTWEPDSIGKNASEGCVRMRNEDVEELFDLVPRGVFVTIRP